MQRGVTSERQKFFHTTSTITKRRTISYICCGRREKH